MALSAARGSAILLALCLSISEGFRVTGARKAVSSLAQGSRTPSCTSKCGEETITVDGEEFEIGAKVDYERTNAECFVGCYIGTSGKSCNPGYSKRSKKGIAFDKKLCCKSQKCTWRPGSEENVVIGEWVEKADSEDQLWPLQDFYEGSVTGNTCLCCSQPGVPWNGRVNQKCKLAYGNEEEDSWKWGFGVFLSFGISDQVWKYNCKRYCTQFPGFTTAKKALQYHAWKAWLPSPSKEPEKEDDPVEVAAALEVELKNNLAVAEAKLYSPDDFKDGKYDVYESIDAADKLRETLEDTEAPDVKSHMDADLLDQATRLLKKLDEETLPTVLEQVLERGGQAFAALPGNREPAEKSLKEINDALFRSENNDDMDHNIEALKSLRQLLIDMLNQKKD